MTKSVRSIILTSCILLILTVVIFGQEEKSSEKPEVTASPMQISIASIRGTAAARRLVLTSNAAVSGVRIIRFDLVGADDREVFPGGSIEARLPAGQVSPTAPLEIPLTFNLTHEAGEYKGEMLILYDGGKLAIPVTVRIKEDRWWPMAVILLGVAAASGLTWYRRRGQPRDEAIKLAGNLRAQARTDTELPSSFRKKIESHLIDCEAALQAEKWEEAKKAVESGIAVMTNWRKWRSDWKKQLEYLAELRAKIEEIGRNEGESSHLTRLRRKLEDEEETVREKPQDLRDRLDGIRGRIDRLIELNELDEKLVGIISELPAEHRAEWIGKRLKWDARIGNLSPDDEEAYKSLRDEITSGIAEAGKLVSSPGNVGAKGAGLFDPDLMQPDLASPPPDLLGVAEFNEAKASGRLKAFKIIAAVIGVFFLAGLGYNELYLTKQTFGANGWYDYFSLLLWGFGAEATRASVIDLMKSWGLQE